MKHAVVVLLASCSWLPPDTPPKKPAPVDRDLVMLVHTWTVENHVMSGRSTLGDRDALEMTGRKVEITASSYKTPWHGTCDDAVHERRERVFADIVSEADLNGEGRATAIRFGFGDPIEEYELSCGENHRVPGLVIYISGDRAMTCFAGVCYLLSADKK